MNMLLTIAAFIVALSALIVVHEYGHYWVARRCGVKVLRFSVGLGRPVWTMTLGADRTEWVIAAIPLGGYVKMLDEREGDVAPHELHRAFNRKSVWQRFAIVLAGPVANFIGAIVLYWVLFVHGVPGLSPVLAEPPAGSAAARAGVMAGDTVTAVDGAAVRAWQDLRWVVLQRAVEGAPAILEARTESGVAVRRELRFDGFDSSDLEGDVLVKLGLMRMRVPLPPVIGELSAGGAAVRDGLRPGDQVLTVNGGRVETWEALVAKIRASPRQALQIRVRRGDADIPELRVIPDAVADRGSEIGRIGAAPFLDPEAMKRMLVVVSYGPLESVTKAVAKTWETSVFSLRMLGKMVTGDISLRNLSGPITIADYAGQSAQNGWISYLLFLALISISLGVLNLLPVPLLDGGHLMYYAVEIFTGKPVSERIMEVGQQIGLTALIVLMTCALYNDINRLIGS